MKESRANVLFFTLQAITLLAPFAIASTRLRSLGWLCLALLILLFSYSTVLLFKKRRIALSGFAVVVATLAVLIILPGCVRTRERQNEQTESLALQK
jgi:hypothetical protein